MNNKSLQFILKCIDYEEFGKLYALNKKISEWGYGYGKTIL